VDGKFGIASDKYFSMYTQIITDPLDPRERQPSEETENVSNENVSNEELGQEELEDADEGTAGNEAEDAGAEDEV
jgi:hypothetical protein